MTDSLRHQVISECVVATMCTFRITVNQEQTNLIIIIIHHHHHPSSIFIINHHNQAINHHHHRHHHYHHHNQARIKTFVALCQVKFGAPKNFEVSLQSY